MEFVTMIKSFICLGVDTKAGSLSAMAMSSAKDESSAKRKSSAYMAKFGGDTGAGS